MQTLATLVPLIILIPSIGAFINFFWGGRLGERYSAIVGTVASGSTFFVALALFSFLSGNYYQPAVVNPPLLDGWLRIESVGLEIPWQMRVDTLSVSMMLFISFVGTFIHVYASGYMHGDPRFSRFFAYLNMFLAFMFILITGNNFLMLFVGWEGVGLCSYLLIGFWWDKPNGEGWKNANAARKAFIANRVGDFGVLMAIFLTFWSFGSLNFYAPTEVNNLHAIEALAAEAEANGEADAIAYVNNDHLAFAQLGVFNQADILAHLEEGETIETGIVGEDGVAETRGREVYFGNFSLDISVVLTLITLFMLVGAAGKSAQIPLFVWLPDAMAGPTPVSALIHAATMVTAGVYMMVRSNVFFYNAPLTALVVTIIGSLTAVVAGFIAIGQFDVKRVLAYSTVSQLGFMVAAVGLGAYTAAMFHMITHAFFKALLFLGSGSVIHGMEHGHHHLHEHDDGHHHDDEAFDPQDMRTMGGLRSKMPITYWTYLIGTLALAGIWPLAGFWSKDEILADAWIALIKGDLRGYIAFAALLGAAAMTAFYMGRQIEMVFHGKPRHGAAEHASENTWNITLPLVVLAICTVLVGFVNIPSGLSSIFVFGLDGLFGAHGLSHFLEQSIANAHAAPPFQTGIALIALTIGLGALAVANMYYGGGRAINKDGLDPLQASPDVRPLWNLANARMYWDDIYFALFINPFNRIAKFLADLDWVVFHDYFHDVVIYKGFNTVGNLLSKTFDRGVIDGVVNGMGSLANTIGGVMRRSQTGYVRVYAVALLLGVVAVVVFMLLPAILS